MMAEEQHEELGNCRHCGARLWRGTDGKLRRSNALPDCLCEPILENNSTIRTIRDVDEAIEYRINIEQDLQRHERNNGIIVVLDWVRTMIKEIS